MSRHGTDVRYTIDPRASRFTVQAFAGGMLSSFGHNPKFAVRDFAGDVELDPETGSGSVRLTAKAGSLDLLDDVSAKDRAEIERQMRDDVLEVSRHPDIVYRSPEDRAQVRPGGGGGFQVALRGDLTLHGVTRPVPVTTRVASHGDQLRASGEATLRQSEFGLRQVSAAGGTLKVKDEVKLAFDIVARK